jgi:phosphoribosylaminoimidazolecarboxamide formyltransferase/IMP cyclohydrolase
MMENIRKIATAFISVYDKNGLAPIAQALHAQGTKIYSTGGTQSYIQSLQIPVNDVETLTGYPSILGGRVKTLHPKIFGGILARRQNADDMHTLSTYEIPVFDLVIVDLYPFAATLASGAAHPEIIEKIDIGGIALIRAAAKNYQDVAIVAAQNQYVYLLQCLQNNAGTTQAQRQYLATNAFGTSAAYDAAIHQYFVQMPDQTEKNPNYETLRYGENPHQTAVFMGNLEELFERIGGKTISYNNLLDIDAALHLIQDFDNATTFAILKHTNACGVASRPTILEAWKDALAGDPISAFGGILITNATIDADTATDISKIFYEVLIAPNYTPQAIEILTKNKKRIVLRQLKPLTTTTQHRTLLNGTIQQQKDLKIETEQDLNVVTNSSLSIDKINDLIFANIIVKHTKSNAIVLAKNQQLIGSGTGQTSRIDALKQAILKAKAFDFDVTNATLASDAFFPFADSVELAHREGIDTIIQPGGSIKDQDSIDYCNQHQMTMIFTGNRHFKH